MIPKSSYLMTNYNISPSPLAGEGRNSVRGTSTRISGEGYVIQAVLYEGV